MVTGTAGNRSLNMISLKTIYISNADLIQIIIPWKEEGCWQIIRKEPGSKALANLAFSLPACCSTSQDKLFLEFWIKARISLSGIHVSSRDLKHETFWKPPDAASCSSSCPSLKIQNPVKSSVPWDSVLRAAYCHHTSSYWFDSISFQASVPSLNHSDVVSRFFLHFHILS